MIGGAPADDDGSGDGRGRLTAMSGGRR
jgi:hypothetical protein